MNDLKKYFILAIVIMTLPLPGFAAPWGRWVSFTSAPLNGVSVRLGAYVYRPSGDGPFPAVVILHGCGGVDWHHKQWAKQVVAWGYIGLVVDSFSARDVRNICEYAWRVTPIERAADIFGAVRFLETEPYVDAASIGILGFSNGAVAGLQAVQKNILHVFELEAFPFKAAVLYYPWCNSSLDQNIAVPTMIHIGDMDDWTQAYRCVELHKWMSRPQMMQLNVYRGAYHAFDRPKGKRTYLGHTLAYDPRAAEQALEKTRAFLERHLSAK